METCFEYSYINYNDKGEAFFSSDEKRWINKIHKLAQTHPEAITILREPETNDGCIYCKMPISWLKVQPPRTMSDEQKQIAADRMRELHKQR